MIALCFFCRKEMEDERRPDGSTVRRCPRGHGRIFIVFDPTTDHIDVGNLEPIAQATA